MQRSPHISVATSPTGITLDSTEHGNPMHLQLDLLNPQQRKAVKHIGGPMLILAGAGSGKTRVITHRVGYLIREGIAPSSILAVSFTNKAAAEMRERVSGLIGSTLADKVHLSTFHSLGNEILRHHISKLGFRSSFTILDQGDQLNVVKDVMDELKLDPERVEPRMLLFLISRAKMALSEPSKLPEFKYHPAMPFAQRAYRTYQSALRGLNAVDFDDLIVLPVKLFREHEKVRKKYGELFQYVMVDEYQDTNHTQLMFLEELVKDHHNIVVVGDDDQSIYAFRGAVSGNILKIEKTFPGTKVVKLEQNYRSTNAILNAANGLIAHNRHRKDKNLWSAKGEGEKITIVQCEDEREESEFVAAEIDGLRFNHGYDYRDFAVLYRVNPQSRLFEEAFRTYRIPYKLLGSAEFFDRKEVKDFIAYLKTCLNPKDEVSLRRIINVPSRGIGPTTVERISEKAAELELSTFETIRRIAAEKLDVQGIGHASTSHLSDFIRIIERYAAAFEDTESATETARALLRDTHMINYIRSQEKSPKIASRRVENLEEILSGIAQFESRNGGTLDGYLTRITLDRTSPNNEDEDEDAVHCMTIHSSKGLEFPVVFMVGLEEGYLPHARSLDEIGGVDEERRLAYVGITRAQERLVMSLSLTRSRYGKQDDREPSRFLEELPEDQVSSNTAERSTTLAEKREEQNQKYLSALKSAIFDD